MLKYFVPMGYEITKAFEEDSIPENAAYDALTFGLNEKHIVYRKAKMTADRPGAFLSLWKRPLASADNNKPIPLDSGELDYLFISVAEYAHTTTADDNSRNRSGLFIFPRSLLVAKKIVSSEKTDLQKTLKGKTGFRVFPPWSADRGTEGTQVFSESGKKTQRWQLPYFVELTDEMIDSTALSKIIDLA